MALVRIRASVEPHVGHGRHVLLEEIRLDDVQHLLHLTEDEHAVLRECAGRGRVRVGQVVLPAVAAMKR